jgi:hypothetical protein
MKTECHSCRVPEGQQLTNQIPSMFEGLAREINTETEANECRRIFSLALTVWTEGTIVLNNSRPGILSTYHTQDRFRLKRMHLMEFKGNLSLHLIIESKSFENIQLDSLCILVRNLPASKRTTKWNLLVWETVPAWDAYPARIHIHIRFWYEWSAGTVTATASGQDYYGTANGNYFDFEF